jgi:hypothetical protein
MSVDPMVMRSTPGGSTPSRIEAMKNGATESRTGLYATVGLIITIGFFAIALIGFFATRT